MSEQTEPTSRAHAIYFSNLAVLLIKEVQEGRAQDASAQLAETQHLLEQIRAIDELLKSPTLWRTYGLLAAIAELKGHKEAAHVYHRREGEAYADFARHRSQIEQKLGFLLPALAQVCDDLEVRALMEDVLPQWEAAGWHLIEVLHRLWAGERDWQRLSEGLDKESALVLLMVLEILSSRTADALPSSEPDESATPKKATLE